MGPGFKVGILRINRFTAAKEGAKRDANRESTGNEYSFATVSDPFISYSNTVTLLLCPLRNKFGSSAVVVTGPPTARARGDSVADGKAGVCGSGISIIART